MNLNIGEILGIIIVALIVGGAAWEFIRTKKPSIAAAVDQAAGGNPKSDGNVPTQQK